jgi:hypothetical protein
MLPGMEDSVEDKSGCCLIGWGRAPSHLWNVRETGIYATRVTILRLTRD